MRYTGARPYVLATNTHAGDLSWLAPPQRKVARKRTTGRRRTARRQTQPWAAVRVRHRVTDMAPVVHEFDPPERFVAGTVGPPGQRTFFLQARAGARVVSVALEKQQVAVLAERIDELLDEVMASPRQRPH